METSPTALSPMATVFYCQEVSTKSKNFCLLPILLSVLLSKHHNNLMPLCQKGSFKMFRGNLGSGHLICMRAGVKMLSDSWHFQRLWGQM